MDIELALEMKANTELKKENRLLKSLLHCSTRSCNNCGKVNCENFQRQRKDCCENWISYIDYIKKLEAQIEKMNELINRYYMVCTEIPKELRTMVFDSCLEDTRKMVKEKEIK